MTVNPRGDLRLRVVVTRARRRAAAIQVLIDEIDDARRD